MVFLYRFLTENLQYISTMLAMRLEPPPQAQPASQPQIEPAQPEGAQQPQQAQQEPFLLLLDVEMDAPVISMPRNTHRWTGPQDGPGA